MFDTTETGFIAQQPLVTISDLPEPPRSVAFRSKQEVVGFAHDILKRICEECVPTGALVFGASAYPMAKRVIDDASIAHRALAMTWPDMDPSAANQTQARDMERSAARVLHDALAVLRETKDVLRVLQFKGDMSEVARCGRAMNEAGIVIRKLEEQFGGEIEWAAEEARDLLR